MATFLALLFAAIPLVITPNLHLYFDVTPKVALLLAGAAVALFLTAWKPAGIAALLAGRQGLWFAVLLTAACLSVLLSTLLSVDTPLSIAGTNWRRFGLSTRVSLLVLVFAAAALRHVRPLLRAFALSGLAAAVYGICQYFGYDPWLPQPAYRAAEDWWMIVRPPSTLGHAGYFAVWLLFPVFAGVALWLDRSSRPWRILGLAATAAGAIAIVLSGTRAGMLGLAAGALTLALCFRPRPSRRLFAAALLVTTAAVMFYFSPPGAMFRRRLHWISQDPGGGARLLLWRDALAMGAHRWPAGFGPETFPLAFPAYQSTGLARAYPDFFHESPHNLLLEMLAEQGLPGATVLLALIALGCAAGLRAARRGLEGKALFAAFIAALVGLQFTPLVVPAALYLYLTIAMLIVLSDELPPAQPALPRHWWIVALASVLGLALLVVAVRLWTADARLAAARDSLDRGDIRAAAAQFQDAQAWGARSDLWYSRLMALASQRSPDSALRLLAWQQGLAAAIRATGSAEDPHNAWYNLAVFRAAQNNYGATESALRGAIRAAPHWFKPHWMLARFLQQTGRLPEAQREAALAESLDAGRHPEVRQTLPQSFHP